MYEELVRDLREQAEHYCKHCSEKSGEHLCGYKGDQYCGPKACLDAADAIEDLENKLNLWRQDKISRWIPVTERLPEVYETVLTYGKHGVLVDYYSGVKSELGNPLFMIMGAKVTHWMPLPEPPKEGEG